jgi:hypothetical protein
MASIVLRSESGKWKYKTKVDDPLFANIVGAMVEEGFNPGKELVIPGELGKILERDWHYIRELQDWMDWEAICVAMSPVEPKDYNPYRSNMFLPAPQKIDYPALPGKVLWRHEMAVLANALTLPEGWEAHVAVDDRSPLIERVSHIRASLDYLRKNRLSALRLIIYIDEQLYAMTANTKDPVVKFKYSGLGSSLMDSFVRNLWLMNLSGHAHALPIVSTRKFIKPPLTLPLSLAYSDWTSLGTILDEYIDKSDKHDTWGAYSITSWITGEVRRLPLYGVQISRSVKGGVGIGYMGSNILDADLLKHIYSRLAPLHTKETHPLTLGLDPILGSKHIVTWKPVAPNNQQNGTQYIIFQGATATSIGNLVGAANASIITYMRWYLYTIQHKGSTSFVSTSREIYLIPREDFPTIVEVLGETVGLYVLRQMLYSLLVYIHYKQEDIKNKKKQKAKPKDIDYVAPADLPKYLERGELFCSLVESYLEKHEGEDEGVKTMDVGGIPQVEKWKKYYD